MRSEKKASATTSFSSAGSLDIFNYVGRSTNLSHQNVLQLINESFERSGLQDTQTSVAVISEDRSLDYCLRDEILKFIGTEPTQDKISIALCRGHLDQAGQIEGNTHWTALHLRRIENQDGTISIQPYHTDSIGGGVPQAVRRVLRSIKSTNLENLEEGIARSEVCQRAIPILKDTNFNECQILPAARQTDGYSCGYHTVFNMIRMHNLITVEGGEVNLGDQITQSREEVSINKFIENSKSNLQQHFNSAIDSRVADSSETSRKPSGHKNKAGDYLASRLDNNKYSEVAKDLTGSILTASQSSVSGEYSDIAKAIANSLLEAEPSEYVDLYRAFSESILISDDSDLNKLKSIIQLEEEIKKSGEDSATVLSSLNFEKSYKKLLSQCVEHIRYSFLVNDKHVSSIEDDSQKIENNLEKLSNAEAAQNPQNFLGILEKLVADPTSLSSSLDEFSQESRVVAALSSGEAAKAKEEAEAAAKAEAVKKEAEAKKEAAKAEAAKKEAKAKEEAAKAAAAVKVAAKAKAKEEAEAAAKVAAEAKEAAAKAAKAKEEAAEAAAKAKEEEAAAKAKEAAEAEARRVAAEAAAKVAAEAKEAAAEAKEAAAKAEAAKKEAEEALKWKFQEAEEKITPHSNPNTQFQVISFEPLVSDYKSIWIASDRGNKFRVIAGVYDENGGDLQNKIERTFIEILSKIAKDTQNKFELEENLSKDQVLAIIEAAKARGGVANKFDKNEQKYLSDEELKKPENSLEVKVGGVEVDAEIAKYFSACFQKECQECGIYTGREKSAKMVGLRLTFIPDDVVKLIRTGDAEVEDANSELRKIKETVAGKANSTSWMR